MSTTFHIACIQCKEFLWLGQSTTQNEAGWYLYTAEEKTMKDFHDFMRKHQSDTISKEYDNIHDIRFINDQPDLDDYTDFSDGTKWGEL